MSEADRELLIGIRAELKSLNEKIDERILPTLYGPDGNNGLTGSHREVKTKVAFLEKMWFIVAAAAAGGLFTAIFGILRR